MYSTLSMSGSISLRSFLDVMLISCLNSSSLSFWYAARGLGNSPSAPARDCGSFFLFLFLFLAPAKSFDSASIGTMPEVFSSFFFFLFLKSKSNKQLELQVLSNDRTVHITLGRTITPVTTNRGSFEILIHPHQQAALLSDNVGSWKLNLSTELL